MAVAAVQQGMRIKTTTTLLLLAFALAAGGCGQERIPQAGATDSKPNGGEPWGRTFLSTSVTENGQPKALVDGTRITLNFFADGHRLGAQAGCNQMGGPASFQGGRLVVDDMATTEMGCDPPRHAQDEWLARFLTSKPSWEREGATLTLDNGAVRIVLEDREVANPDRPLRGTKWVVDTLVERDAASSVPAGVEAHLTVEEGKQFRGNTGCNGMGGNSDVHEDRSTITFSEVITTKMACDDDRMRVERAVLATLDGDVRYQIDADVLRLDGPGGRGLRLRAAQS
ncbi:MAG TPA: META domain-containing protein [Acidimicrobiia bacterium]|nr:META domain-containing protein [Acidimicrobiia bacterium]